MPAQISTRPRKLPMSARPMRESKKSRLIRRRMLFPDDLLELIAKNRPRLLAVYTRANGWRWESRPCFPGWAGTPAETADRSLAKPDEEAAKIRANSLKPSSATGEDCSWHE